MDIAERIITFMRGKGPVLPVQVSKEIKDNILMTSARLSELFSSKKIKISSLKVGGSPLYYLLGQESLLQNFSSNLSPIENKAYELLSHNKILQDSRQEPAIRVALRQIKDFAAPLNVTYNNNMELFWKWYLLGNNEAESIIKEILSKIPLQEKIAKGSEQNMQLRRENTETAKVMEEVKLAAEKPTIIERQKELVRREATKKPKQPEDRGYEKYVTSFFASNNILVLEPIETKKPTGLDFIVELQTSIGNIRYFCRYKHKKKINDADISSALVQAQSKNLPLLFLSNGDASKKAQDMLNKELRLVIYKKI